MADDTLKHTPTVKSPRTGDEMEALRSWPETLKDCPFCGSKPSIIEVEADGRCFIFCGSDYCHVQPEAVARDLGIAKRYWQRRA